MFYAIGVIGVIILALAIIGLILSGVDYMVKKSLDTVKRVSEYWWAPAIVMVFSMLLDWSGVVVLSFLATVLMLLVNYRTNK